MIRSHTLTSSTSMMRIGLIALVVFSAFGTQGAGASTLSIAQSPDETPSTQKQTIKAIYIPLADHSVAITMSNFEPMIVWFSRLKKIMDLAVEAGVLDSTIDLDTFSDHRFATQITWTQDQRTEGTLESE